VLVCSHTFEPFEHFKSFQCDTALRGMRARKDRAENGMRVQDRAGVHASRDGDMQQRLRGWAAIAAHDVSRFIYLQKLCRREASLV